MKETKLKKNIFSRYEDLVEDTENELKRIYKLLDIPFTEQVVLLDRLGSTFRQIR